MRATPFDIHPLGPHPISEVSWNFPLYKKDQSADMFASSEIADDVTPIMQRLSEFLKHCICIRWLVLVDPCRYTWAYAFAFLTYPHLNEW